MSSTTIGPDSAEEFFVELELTRAEGMVDERQIVRNLKTELDRGHGRRGLLGGVVTVVTRVRFAAWSFAVQGRAGLVHGLRHRAREWLVLTFDGRRLGHALGDVKTFTEPQQIMPQVTHLTESAEGPDEGPLQHVH